MEDQTVHWLLGVGSLVCATGICGLFAWMLNMTRTVLTRDEHTKICQDRNQMLADQLDEIKQDLIRYEVQSNTYREQTTTMVTKILQDVAVIKDRTDRGDKSERKSA